VQKTTIKPVSNKMFTHTFESMRTLMGDKATYNKDKGYMTDNVYNNVLYMPEYV